MDDIKIYNKYLSKQIFEIEDPLPPARLPNVRVKFEFLGKKDLIYIGDVKEHLTFKIEVLPSGVFDKMLDYVLGDRNSIEISTTDIPMYPFVVACSQKLKEFMELFGEKRPVWCIELSRQKKNDEMNESLIKESKHDTLVSDIVKDILIKLKQFKNSDEKEGTLDLPEEGDYYQTPFINGESYPFFVELYLFKDKSENYKIDADAPIDMEENNITIVIYFNPEKLKEQIGEIKNNLFYTLRHEYEHLLQTIHDYENVTYPKTHKYKKDSLKTLLKRQEIEPQLRGYLLQSRKERKPFDVVINQHLDKLEKNNQINFLGPERKQIVVNVLVDYAKQIKLPIKLSNDFR